MHVLVKNAQEDKVSFFVGRLASQQLKNPVAHLIEVTKRSRSVGQRQIPTRVMRDSRRVVERIRGQLEKTARVRQVRKDIARIKTIAAEKSAAKKA